jgi:hypothetical protein
MSVSALLDNAQVKRCMKLLHGLSDLNIAADDIELPRICVAGSQSAGKSSVMEAISSVNLPRGAGTVTRCPIEMRLARVTKDSESGIWVKIKDETDHSMGELVEAADLATKIQELCDKVRGDNYFCEQPIVVDIRNSKVMDLTLIDLPGVVGHVKDGNRTVEEKNAIIDQSKRMTMNYIKDPMTTILVVREARSDVELNLVGLLVEQVDPKAERTIEVITKPDLLENDPEALYKALVADERTEKYVVRCRDRLQTEKGLTLDEAHAQEVAFFRELKKKSTADTPFDRLQKSFGVPLLVKKLSEFLFQQIHENIPAIRAKLNAKLEQAQEEAKRIGDAPPTSSFQMRSLYFTAIKNLEKQFERQLLEDDGPRAVPSVYKVLRRTSEQFVVDLSSHASMEKRCSTSDKKVDDNALEHAAAKVPAPMSVHDQYTALGQQEDTFADFLQTSMSLDASQPQRSSPKPTIVQYFKRLIRDSRGKEIEGFPRFAIFQTFLSTILDDFDRCAVKLAADVFATMEKNAKQVISHVLERYPAFSRDVGMIAEETLKSRLDQLHQRIHEKMESERWPFTINHYYSQNELKLLAKVFGWDEKETAQQAQNMPRASGTPGYPATPLRQTAAIGPLPGSIATLSNADTEAIQFAIRVYSFLKVAYKRIADDVPLMIAYHFEQWLKSDFGKVLDNHLERDEEGILEKWFAESPVIVEKRRKLSATIDRLSKGQQLVKDF